MESDVDIRAYVADLGFAFDSGGEKVNAEIGRGVLGCDR
jgi:hypothetical protein